MTKHSLRHRPRGEPTRRALAGRGLAVLLLFVALLGLTYVRATGTVGGDPEVSALVRNAGGSLRPGSDVKINGVIIGRVTEITRGPDGNVRVGLVVDKDDLGDIPANVEARILPATVFGTTFVDLVVYDGASDDALEAGATIPADDTQGTLELQQALDDIDRLVTALGPAELASAIGSAAEALDGRGEKIGQIIETADAYLARLTPLMPLVRSDLRKLAANLELIDQVAPDLLQATEDGLVTLHTIATQKAAITALISGGTALSRTTTAFISDNQRELIRFIDNGAMLMDVLYDNRRAGISGAISTNIAVGRAVPSAIREGFIKSDAIIQTVAPDFYTAADRPRYGLAAPRAAAGTERRSRADRLTATGLRGLMGGKPMTGLRTILVKFTAFAVASLALLLILVNTMTNGLGSDARSYDAVFTDVSGLRPGDDVKVAGVRVGRVKTIEVDGDHARVSFELADTQPLLDTTNIVMRYQNLLGQRYLALVQTGERGAEIEGGTTIPLERTSPGFNLTELLNGFRPLFEVLEPADVNKLATSMVKVLQGEGGTVEVLLQQTADLTTFLADRDEVFHDVVTNLTPVLDNLAGEGDEFTATVQELRGLMTGLARDRRAIGSSIDGVSRLVGSTSELLQDAREPAIASIREFVKVADMVARTRKDLNAAIKKFGLIFEGLGRAGSYESAVNVYPCSFILVVSKLLEVNPAGDDGPWSQVCS